MKLLNLKQTMTQNNPEEKLENFWFLSQILAAGRTLEGGDQWAFRRITREYSIKFSVPLPEVRKMPFQDVLLEVLEARLDSVKRADLIVFIRELLNDENAEAKASEERFKRYEEEEKVRLQKQITRKPKVKKQKLAAMQAEAPVQIIKRSYSMGNPDE